MDGTSQLKVSVNTKAGNFLLAVGIYLQPSQWNSTLHIITNHPQKAFLNSHLTNLMLQAEQLLLFEQQKAGKALSKLKTKKLMESLFCSKQQVKAGEVESVFQQFAKDNSKKQRTREIYGTTWKKIKEFVGRESSSLSFDDIDLKWLRSFNRWLIPQCPAVNARAIHFRNLRAVFNAAIDDDITTNYPFRKFKIEHEKTRKRALSIQQLRELRTMPLKDWQRRYVDCFFLMFYLLGINGIDLLSAKQEQVVDGRLEYRRAKTGTLYSIKLEPEALEIINRYKGKKHLVNFGERYKDYTQFMAKLNNCLKELIPGCTSYYARHSVASIAAELDIPLDTIARMLGHSDPSKKITLIYVDFNQGKVDKANRKIIDYLFSDTAEVKEEE
ncbi:MAG: site-specific integrase [Prevotella sp.]|nr:site-specific integrase [Prevotella sp.]